MLPVPAANMRYGGGRHQGRLDPPRPHRVIELPPGDRLPAGARARPPARASLIWPDSSSALTCASAMMNLMCGASKERVATVYPASAAATASVVRPASADTAAIAQAVSRANEVGQLLQGEVFDDCLAASGLPIANQYTVRKASIQLRACGGVVRDASSMSFFAPRGVAKRPEHVAGPQERESGVVAVGQFAGANSASTASASWPRLSHDNACARTKFASAPPPARMAASASRSASGRSASQTAPWAALTSRSGSGLEVGVETQCGAAHHDSHVVAVIGCGEFGGDQSPQPPQPGGCRASAAHLAVERMRHPHLHTAIDGFERDEATRVGLLDRRRIGDPRQRPPARSARRQPAHRSRR